MTSIRIRNQSKVNYRDLGFMSMKWTRKDKEDARKVYGMVTNIDDI